MLVRFIFLGIDFNKLNWLHLKVEKFKNNLKLIEEHQLDETLIMILKYINKITQKISLKINLKITREEYDSFILLNKIIQHKFVDSNIDINFSTNQFGIIGDLMMIDYPKFLIGNTDSISVQLHDNMEKIYISNIMKDKYVSHFTKFYLHDVFRQKYTQINGYKIPAGRGRNNDEYINKSNMNIDDLYKSHRYLISITDKKVENYLIGWLNLFKFISKFKNISIKYPKWRGGKPYRLTLNEYLNDKNIIDIPEKIQLQIKFMQKNGYNLNIYLPINKILINAIMNKILFLNKFNKFKLIKIIYVLYLSYNKICHYDCKLISLVNKILCI